MLASKLTPKVSVSPNVTLMKVKLVTNGAWGTVR